MSKKAFFPRRPGTRAYSKNSGGNRKNKNEAVLNAKSNILSIMNMGAACPLRPAEERQITAKQGTPVPRPVENAPAALCSIT